MAIAGTIVLAVGLFCTAEAKAQCSYGYGGGYSSGYGGHGGGYGGYGGGYGGGCNTSRPIWHGPSVHYDRVYHPTRVHWTPRRGLHTHGHYDYVPHFVPGHYDFLHGNHIHTNPRYHR